MPAEDISHHLDQRPFRPFLTYLSDGKAHDIRHPELIMAGRSSVFVGITEKKRQRLVERIDHCPLLHVTRIDPLNGRRGRGAANGRKG